jgi:hypothetical protein
MTLKVSEPERGPGLWKMNNTVIQTDLFKNIFESFWNKWELQKNEFENKLEWWEQTKIKIKSLTIGVSKKLNITETKLKIWETTLEKLVESNSDNKNEISELRGNIKGYYEKKAEASRIRSKVNWYEKGEKSTKYFFNPEKKKGKEKLTIANIKRILCLF